MTPKLFFSIAATGLVVAISLYPGFHESGRQQPVSMAGPRILYYACPMHPETRSDRPGKAIDCGMDLQPVYAQADSKAESPATVIRVSQAAEHLIGLRTAPVHTTVLSRGLRLAGRVAVDEARQYRIIAGSDGWVRKLGSNSAGAMVEKGEVLASYYTPGLLGASQSLLYAISANEQSTAAGGYAGLQKGSGSLSLQVAVDGLRVLGMSELQIDQLKATREATAEVQVYAPATGVVIARSLSPEQRLDRGMELYRIADLRRVWVQAQVFEKDNALLKPGVQAVVRYAGRELLARMSDSLPQFDAQSRTFRARFELDNPGLLLRPDMFVDVELAGSGASVLAVPSDSVINPGRDSFVYVALGDGRYEVRRIRTGASLGDMVEVADGLREGDQVVVAGNFMLDSESRLHSTSAAPEHDSRRLESSK